VQLRMGEFGAVAAFGSGYGYGDGGYSEKNWEAAGAAKGEIE
jgi:hypothetical protein